jgi:hypothetical protein
MRVGRCILFRKLSLQKPLKVVDSEHPSKDSQVAQVHFKATTKKDQEGQFIVWILFICKKEMLADTYFTAKVRLQNMESKFCHDAQL